STGLLQTPIERLAGEVLHHDERLSVGAHAVVVDLDHVLALQLGGRPRFGLETTLRVPALHVLDVDELDGHTSAELVVDAFPDRAHAAATEQTRESVLAGHQSGR